MSVFLLELRLRLQSGGSGQLFRRVSERGAVSEGIARAGGFRSTRSPPTSRGVPDISAVADRLADKASDCSDGWNAYHAGVAAYLAGRTAKAEQFFTDLSRPRPDDPPGAEWLHDLRATARVFATITGERDALREALEDFVKQSRIALRLRGSNVELPDADRRF